MGTVFLEPNHFETVVPLAKSMDWQKQFKFLLQMYLDSILAIRLAVSYELKSMC